MSNSYPPNSYGSSSSYDPYQQPAETYPQYSQSGEPYYPSSQPQNPYQSSQPQTPYGQYSQPPVYSQPVVQPVYVQPMIVAQPTNGKATAAMVLGLCIFLVGFFTGIPAIILGHMALNEINRSGGTQGGRGQAITGLILGYLSVAGLAVCIFCYMLGGLATLLNSH